MKHTQFNCRNFTYNSVPLPDIEIMGMYGNSPSFASTSSIGETDVIRKISPITNKFAWKFIVILSNHISLNTYFYFKINHDNFFLIYRINFVIVS